MNWYFLDVLENIDQELSFKSNLKGIRSVEMFLESIEKSSVSLKFKFPMENEVSLTPPSEGFSNNSLHMWSLLVFFVNYLLYSNNSFSKHTERFLIILGAK